MSRQLISSGSEFEVKLGYSRAVVEDGYVFVSGTTGYNYDTMSIVDDIAAQTEQCFLNIEKALKSAGSSLKDVVRIRYIYADRADCEASWPVLQKYLGAIRPAATMIVAGLLDDKMKIEIEVTAKIGSGS